MTDCCVCSGERSQVEKIKVRIGLGRQSWIIYSESIHSTLYTTDICSMSKVRIVSNHKVLELHISMSHRDIIRWSGKNSKLVTVGDGNELEKGLRKLNGRKGGN